MESACINNEEYSDWSAPEEANDAIITCCHLSFRTSNNCFIDVPTGMSFHYKGLVHKLPYKLPTVGCSANLYLDFITGFDA